jgi:hypothetical protein
MACRLTMADAREQHLGMTGCWQDTDTADTAGGKLTAAAHAQQLFQLENGASRSAVVVQQCCLYSSMALLTLLTGTRSRDMLTLSSLTWPSQRLIQQR